MATAATLAAEAGCDIGTAAAASASEIKVEGRPVVAEEVNGNDDEEAPMLTAAEAATATAPFNKDYRLDFTDVEGNLEEIPEEGTARMAAAAGSGKQRVPAEGVELDSGSKDGEGGGAVVEGAEAAAAPAVAVVTATAHFHIPESNASDYAYSECSFQVSNLMFQWMNTLAEVVTNWIISISNLYWHNIANFRRAEDFTDSSSL